jgi:hypothetical protein
MVAVPVERSAVEVPPLRSTIIISVITQSACIISVTIYLPGVSGPLFQISPLVRLKLPAGAEVTNVKGSAVLAGQVVLTTEIKPGWGAA